MGDHNQDAPDWDRLVHSAAGRILLEYSADSGGVAARLYVEDQEKLSTSLADLQ